MAIFLNILGWLLAIFSYALIARAIIDLVIAFKRGFRPTGALVVLFEVVFTVTDPPLKFVRRFVPPLRLGAIQFDLAWPILLIAIRLVGNLLKQIAITYI
ncbi:MAG: hypothetical protein RL716_843 [Actinomycetota bacterium]|jgi:YggT family protein|uniref:YggT family protein n=1 Tax=Rhodoluna sp. TaxID=1969481 RepID=UPI0025FBC53E|nr:YggT family protein [Rhodoluna sp.]